MMNSPNPSRDGDVAFKTATELSRMLRARKISSVELTRIFLDRLETLGPQYNALAELTGGLAMEQARRADRLLRGSRAAAPPPGGPPSAGGGVPASGGGPRGGA